MCMKQEVGSDDANDQAAMFVYDWGQRAHGNVQCQLLCSGSPKFRGPELKQMSENLGNIAAGSIKVSRS